MLNLNTQQLEQEKRGQVEFQNPTRILLTVKQFAQKHNFLSESALRKLIFQRKANGFSNVIKRINKKILIDESALFSWIDAQNN